MGENELSTADVAQRLGVSAITARLWCRRGLFPNAREEKTARGPVWVIPAGDLEGFTPPKPTTAEKPSRRSRKKAAK